jgi:hypothetical protein
MPEPVESTWEDDDWNEPIAPQKPQKLRAEVMPYADEEEGNWSDTYREPRRSNQPGPRSIPSKPPVPIANSDEDEASVIDVWEEVSPPPPSDSINPPTAPSLPNPPSSPNPPTP